MAPPQDRRSPRQGGGSRGGDRRPDRGTGENRDGRRRGDGRPDGQNPDRRRRPPDDAGPKNWGGVARRAAGRLEREEAEDRGWRREQTAERTTRPDRTPPGRSDRLRREAADAVARGVGPARSGRVHRALERQALPDAPRRLPDADVALRRALGDAAGSRASAKLREAARAFDDERFNDARRILNSLVERAPEVVEVVELLGLTHYRIGNWKAAAKRLEVFRDLTGGTEQHPVLADCYRAQGRWADVEVLWAELRNASPGAALVTEGRLVAAGALADQGRMADAVRELERGWSVPKRARDHHLRRAYALADLYERSGATPRARELFRWIASRSPDFADVSGRLRSLS
ncbi:MAG: hypothetical protein QF522_08900 [Acidimicrobiales bacterium]|nr:hypothetical protein [Acidimicrobiales bacterium]MDP6760263.1 hypothetical protein [Acidimicrobiales bacterium]